MKTNKEFAICDLRFANETARSLSTHHNSKFKIRNSKFVASRAFTLVEIMVVVIIIGVLAAMIVVPYFGKAGQAKHSVAKHDISVLESAVNMFQQDYGRFPANLSELVTKPADISDDKWSATGIKASNLNDPWGRPFNYTYPGTNWAFEITSYGADGQPGGEGENADINNWE